MTTQNFGMSKRSLLLLGGLTAAVTNPAARQRLLDALSSAADSAQTAYQDTVKPLAHQAQAQLQAGVQDVQARTQELAHIAAERGAEFAHIAAERGSDLAQVAAKRGAELAHVAAERGGELAQVAAKRGAELASQGGEAAAGVASLAAERGGKVAASVRESVLDLRETGGRQAQNLLSSAHDTLDDVRKDGSRVVRQKVRQGRKQALRLQKELSHEVGVRGRELEKLSGRKLRQAEKELVELKKRGDRAQKAVQKSASRTIRRVEGKPEPGGSAMTAVLVSTGLLVAGGVLLARVPAVRHNILKAVGSVSPEAEGALHRAGTTVRDLVGSIWLERIEPETATQAPAPKASQATGSAAGASVEPGAPAQATPPAPESTPTEGSGKN